VESVTLSAGRQMLRHIHQLVDRQASFGLETTCAGRSYVRLLQKCKSDGWRITLLFLWLDSPESAIDWVARRVAEGGHSAPAGLTRRRYRAGLASLLDLYLPLADEAEIYDNSGSERILIAEKRKSSMLHIHDWELWKAIQRSAR
jgi:predicted ABC-type ATPase